MFRTIHARLFAVLLLGAGAHAAAQTPAAGSRAEKARATLQQRFAAADGNADGRLSRAEAQAGMPWVHRQFDAIDTAHSGTVTLAQIESHAVAQGAARSRAAR